VDGNCTGLQGLGAVSHVGSGEVVQIGLVNTADDALGFQLGIVNFAENFYGLQVGLLNIIESKNSWSFLPIVNWSF